MISRKKNSEWGIIVNCEEARIYDSPDKSAPLVCQLRAGKRVKILSRPNRDFVGIGVTNSVVGFVLKDYIKAE